MNLIFLLEEASMKEELKKLFPKHQQIDGARRIAVHMDIENNQSISFQHFVSGVKRLCENISQ